MNLDKNLMLAYLREREAFGWAMSSDACSRDQQHAADMWREYSRTVLAARQEIEAQEPVPECKHDWLFRPDLMGARCCKCGEERVR